MTDFEPAPLADAIVIGGSFAGLSAALQLARARRSVVVIDTGQPRNRFASHPHGVVGHDGRPGHEILADAREQLLAYPTVAWRDSKAVQAQGCDEGFRIRCEDGREVQGRRLLLAHGVADVLPAIEGVEERWGRTALHCPWCHGYEIGGGPIGVLGRGPMAAHYAGMVAEWGDVTLFLATGTELSSHDLKFLTKRGVTIEQTPLVGLEGPSPALEGARLEDGRLIPVKAMFVGGEVRIDPSLAEQLGCALVGTPIGTLLQIDEQQQTTVPGVYAAGDLARPASNITWATCDGMAAGHAIFRSLLEEETA